MLIQCLGAFILSTEETQTIPRPSGRATLFIALLVNANDTLTSDQLIEEIWPDHIPDDPYGSLHAQISRLRKDMRNWGIDGVTANICHQHPGYMLTIDESLVDISTFTSLVEQCTAAFPSDPETAMECARRGLEIWHGTPFTAHRVGFLGKIARMRLEESQLIAQEVLVDSALAMGLHRHSIGRLKELVVTHPYRERFHEQLMTALYRSGRQGEALQVYREACTRLHRELGIEPSPPLQQLMNRMLQQDPAVLDYSPLTPWGLHTKSFAH
ncbi:AfsR/SARP family transcriptional regulator [Streptomyces chartreusis]|uniref:AfsR/SARP family transcriptional regulator n=1 Tax=Streptomyces chartreusis TaxID=1969 RepID=UPI003823D169